MSTMKLSELAAEYALEPDLLREVVEEDLSIALPKGMESVLSEADITRILACDGLETVDGEAFTPIIAAEFVKKHERSVAAKKAAQTRKRKLEEEEANRRREAEAKQEEERRKHEAALREQEEKRRKHDEEEARRREVEELTESARREHEDALRAEEQRRAEEALRRREEESARIHAELAALRTQTLVVEPTPEAPVAQALALSGEEDRTDAEDDDNEVSAPGNAADSNLGNNPGKEPSELPQVLTIAESTDSSAARPAPAKPAPVIANTKPKVSGLGSKLATLAKVTHEKADHRIKDKDIKELATVAPANAAAPDQVLTSDQRRAAIQENIRRNLLMAQRVKNAKAQAATRKRGFRTIDRSKGPAGPGGAGSPASAPGGRGPGGPGAGPGGPGGGPGAGRGGRPGKGKKGKDKYEIVEEEVHGGTRRVRRMSTDEIDLSGITEFAIAMPCTVREFSEASGLKANAVIAKLFMAGVVANVNSVMERDQVELLAMEFKKTVTIKEAADIEDELEAAHQLEENDADLAPRPPVVTILGHVDHGKTSLLDAIRKTHVTAGEAGGITQHIGAYTVATGEDMQVTFIDTPGHEAFTEMRARGAQVTDVAVIVVAADDGIMPQTLEAINHAKAAEVAIVVAMNKIDKPTADPDKVLRQLAEQGLQPEEWGGDVGVIRVSALTGQGIPELLDRLALETEMQELKANHFANASGVVLEAHMSEGQGITATLLVQRGSLAAGDIILAGTGYGRVRNMRNWKNDVVEVAGPSIAVEVIGLSELPRAGDRFQVLEDLKQAAEAAEERQHRLRDRELRAKAKTTTLASLFDDIASSKLKEVRLILKADTSGSLEVLKKTIGDLGNDEVRVNIVHSGVGCVSTGDVTLAEASKAVVIGFHVIADAKARQQAEASGVDIKSYTIIYELLDNLRLALTGMLDPETIQKVIGHAEVREVFQSSKFGTIAGLYITDGVAQRGCYMRITRDGVIIHDGKVNTLRRFKEDVKEVRDGYECGLTVEKFHDVQKGDTMEFYVKESIARSL